MLMATVAGLILALVTILVHYEVLRLTWVHLRDLPLHPRFRIVVVVVVAFLSHTVHVWIYGFAYWFLHRSFGMGGIRHGLTGEQALELMEYIYFSSVTYTSLGFGDFIPAGHFRMLVGMEGLNGLILIAWTASFTYLAMQEYWPLHGGRPPSRDRDAGNA